MARCKGGFDRIRVGKVTLYWHHGAWWIYFSEGTQRSRRKVSESQKEAEVLAAQVNLRLTQGAPMLGKRLAEGGAVFYDGRKDQHPLNKSEVRLSPG